MKTRIRLSICNLVGALLATMGMACESGEEQALDGAAAAGLYFDSNTPAIALPEGCNALAGIDAIPPDGVPPFGGTTCVRSIPLRYTRALISGTLPQFLSERTEIERKLLKACSYGQHKSFTAGRVSSSGACPLILNSNWRGSKAYPDVAATHPLGKYCRYTFAGIGQPQQADFNKLSGLLNAATFKDVSVDCYGVVQQSEDTSLDALMAVPFRENFVARAGRIASNGFPPAIALSKVRLAIVDNLPTHDTDELAETPQDLPERHTETAPENRSYEHGFAMTNFAKRLTCNADASVCATQIVSEQAMYGSFGTQSDLAKAIRKVVKDWVQTPRGTSHLVINLSLGWDGIFGSELDGLSMPPQAEEVYHAIAEANCHGALVFAAAGNENNSFSKPVGPIMPAGWYSIGSLSKTSCAQYALNTSNPKIVKTPLHNLVMAVGGVSNKLDLLDNQRTGGLPGLVAFGDHATVLAATGTPTAVMTGTSVSSVIGASAAALAWALRPNADTTTVLLSIKDSGMILEFERHADFSYGCFPAFGYGTSQQSSCHYGFEYPEGARQISVCKAAQLACANNACPLVLPGLLACTGLIQAEPDLIDDTLQAQLSLFPEASDVQPLPDNVPIPLSDSQNWDADDMPFDSAPTGPQPGDNICPACLYNINTMKVKINLDPMSVVGGKTNIPIRIDIKLSTGVTKSKTAIIPSTGVTRYVSFVGSFASGTVPPSGMIIATSTGLAAAPKSNLTIIR